MPQRKFYWTHNNNIAADVSSFIVFILPFSIKRLPPVMMYEGNILTAP